MANGPMFAIIAIFDSLTGGEVILVMVLALMVLGPERLPEAARTLGVWLSKLRAMSSNLQSEVREVLDDPAMQPIREVGEFMAAPRKKLVEYATAAEAEAAADAAAVGASIAAGRPDPVLEAEAEAEAEVAAETEAATEAVDRQVDEDPEPPTPPTAPEKSASFGFYEAL